MQTTESPKAGERTQLESHIEMLRSQNAELLERAEQMQRFIATFPALIIKVRLDAKEGRQTNYNYVVHNLTQRPL